MSGTARVQPEATLHSGEFELLVQWLPDQRWFDGDPSNLEIVAKFRFVDPDDVVGFDCMLVCSADAIYHIPAMWRPYPLNGGVPIGTLQHSELGTRCCYDVQTDPVCLDELVRVIREKDSDADTVETGKDTPCPENIKVFSSGLVAGETSGYPHVVYKLNCAPISDVVGQLTGQWCHRSIDRVDLLAILY